MPQAVIRQSDTVCFRPDLISLPPVVGTIDLVAGNFIFVEYRKNRIRENARGMVKSLPYLVFSLMRFFPCAVFWLLGVRFPFLHGFEPFCFSDIVVYIPCQCIVASFDNNDAMSVTVADFWPFQCVCRWLRTLRISRSSDGYFPNKNFPTLLHFIGVLSLLSGFRPKADLKITLPYPVFSHIRFSLMRIPICFSIVQSSLRITNSLS